MPPKPMLWRPRTLPFRCLLPVALQDRITRRADLGAVLLEAREHREIALVDHMTAETLRVARAGPLLFRRAARVALGESRGGQRRQGEDEEKFTHRVPSFDSRAFGPGYAGTDHCDCRRRQPLTTMEARGSAKCGQIYDGLSLLAARLPPRFDWHI